jgi:hypothetical protein
MPVTENPEQSPQNPAEEIARLRAELARENALREQLMRALEDADTMFGVLNNAEGLFFAAFHSTPVAMAIQQDGKYVLVNEAFGIMTGYSREEVIGHSGFELGLYPNDVQYQKMVEEFNRKGSLNNFEFSFRHKSGEIRIGSVSVTSVEVSGKLSSLVTTIDTTDQKRVLTLTQEMNVALEEQVKERTAELVRVNQELESFAYSVSHDLRAPLRGVIGYARLLMKDYDKERAGTIHEFVEKIFSSAMQMNSLIDGLLAFAKKGKQALNCEDISAADLRKLVDDVVTILCEVETDRQIRITIGELAPCYADRLLLREVFLNLIGNAIKYTRGRELALIEIGMLQTDQGNAYFIRDNGAGFDMQYATRLFGLFQRLHGGDEFEGSGIGLALVNRIVERHEGQIWAQAEVGKGATFYFTLG